MSIINVSKFQVLQKASYVVIFFMIGFEFGMFFGGSKIAKNNGLYLMKTPLNSLKISRHDVDFKKYCQIIITGPHRSGTTFIAKTLSKELNYDLLDEVALPYDLEQLMEKYGKKKKCFVAQAPSVTSSLHHFETPNNNEWKSLFVFVVRNCLDNYKSGERIKWNKNFEYLQIEKYTKQSEFNEIFDPFIPHCISRQDVWLNYQRKKMKLPYIELDYESFNDHEKWIPREERENFLPKQVF